MIKYALNNLGNGRLRDSTFFLELNQSFYEFLFVHVGTLCSNQKFSYSIELAYIMDMRVTQKMIILGSILFFVGSCASKSFKEPQTVSTGGYSTSRTFGGNMDKVWEATKDAMEQRNMVIAQTLRDKGTIVTDWATGKSDRLFSGYGDTKIPYTIRFKFLVQLSTGAGKVQVSIKSKEEYMTDIVTSGNDFNGSVYQWVPTSSSGFKEQTLLEDISAQLQQDRD